MFLYIEKNRFVMKVIADLHIHSRFSRATSNKISIGNLEKYARIKGLNLLGTGDFTHPEWIKELKEKLKEDGTGILKTETGFNFILQTEISLIYTQGRGRRIHLVLLAPNFKTVDKITDYLKKHGRVDYDGRPIFKISCEQIVRDLREISEDIEIIPAHIWTPWFGLLGSKSGFDSFEEAFGEQVKHIHALETGLSSDPPMNWRLSKLDKYTLVSNSDLHSFWPWRIGREANIIEPDKLTYKHLIDAIKNKKVKTIEVDPGYGKYHFDGHRNCDISMSPKESKEHNGICPVCKKPLTIGVLNRVEELADRPSDFIPKDAQEFLTLMPLSEIINMVKGYKIGTKKNWQEYYKLVNEERSEFYILLNAPKEELMNLCGPEMTEVIIKNRKAEIDVRPGYDGEYGVPFYKNKTKKQQIKQKEKQLGLNNF